jgi:dTDP-4-amino-4,6-dideoxygalactose transaminase
MDGIQGAVLSVKVKYLADWNRSRRRNAAIYSRLLGDVKGIALPGEADYREHVYHLYPVRCHNRDLLGRYLTGKEIGWGIHYPVPVHLQEAYRFLGHKRGDFPVAEACAEAMISLPMFAELTEEQIAYVCREIESFISGSRGVVKEDRILSAGLQG